MIEIWCLSLQTFSVSLLPYSQHLSNVDLVLELKINAFIRYEQLYDITK